MTAISGIAQSLREFGRGDGLADMPLAVFGDMDGQADRGDGQAGAAHVSNCGEIFGPERADFFLEEVEGLFDLADQLGGGFGACALERNSGELFGGEGTSCQVST